jgi:hypothetical protein
MRVQHLLQLEGQQPGFLGGRGAEELSKHKVLEKQSSFLPQSN